jgi:hypothetical protein
VHEPNWLLTYRTKLVHGWQVRNSDLGDHNMNDVANWMLWAKAHHQAMEKFIAGETDLDTFTNSLLILGFDEPDLSSELDHARAERAEKAATMLYAGSVQ